MPGHFLLRDCADADGFVDPFHGGRRLDRAGCAEIFARAAPRACRSTSASSTRRRPRRARCALVTNLVRTYTVARPGHVAGVGAAPAGARSPAATRWLPVAQVRERLGDWDGAAAALARSDASTPCSEPPPSAPGQLMALADPSLRRTRGSCARGRRTFELTTVIDRDVKRCLGQMMKGVQVVAAAHDGVVRGLHARTGCAR